LSEPLYHERRPAFHQARFFEFDLTSAPIVPHLVHAMRGPNEGTVTSPGRWSMTDFLAVSHFAQTHGLPRAQDYCKPPSKGGSASQSRQWRGAVNDARRYRLNAAECPSAAETCHSEHRSLLLSIAASWHALARQDEATRELLNGGPCP
jgi:hypothetical protein